VTRLYLGRQTAQGEVSDAQWQAFVDDTVAVAFPDGFTVFDARGHWRGDDGRAQREASQVVEVVHAGAAAARARAEAVADAYRHRFAQQAVLVTEGAQRSCLRR